MNAILRPDIVKPANYFEQVIELMDKISCRLIVTFIETINVQYKTVGKVISNCCSQTEYLKMED